MSQIAAVTRREATREAILGAAFERFTRYGYRRTSMDDLAQTADISRAAVYLHFRSKEEVFRALAAQLHDASMGRAEAIAVQDAPLADRVAGVLREKLAMYTEVVAASPHGAELLDENNRACGDISLAARKRFVKLLSEMITTAGRRGELPAPVVSPTAAAELAYDWLRGIEGAGLAPGPARRRVDQAALLLVRGLGAGA